jgi:hypothetical protein
MKRRRKKLDDWSREEEKVWGRRTSEGDGMDLDQKILA